MELVLPNCNVPFAMTDVDIKELSGNLLRDLMAKHGVLIFRKQVLSPQELVTVNKIFELHDGVGAKSSNFGWPERRQIVNADNIPDVQVQGNANGMKLPTGLRNEGFHSDSMHCQQFSLPTLTSMYCIEAPTSKGETFFACGRLAFRNLSPMMQIFCQEVKVRYAYQPEKLPEMDQRGIVKLNLDSQVPQNFIVHPLIRTHVDTGERSIIVSCGNVIAMEVCGMVLDRKDSYAFIDFLLHDVVVNPSLFVHAWKKNDFAIWDNRLCLHSGPDISKIVGNRVMQRVRLDGDPRCYQDCAHVWNTGIRYSDI